MQFLENKSIKRGAILLMSAMLALAPSLSAKAQFVPREYCSLLEKRYAEGYCLTRYSPKGVAAATVTATGTVIYVNRIEFTAWPSGIVYTAYVGIPSDCVAPCTDDFFSMFFGVRASSLGLESYPPTWRDLLLATAIISPVNAAPLHPETRYSYQVGSEEVAANYAIELRKAVELLDTYAAGADSQI